MKQLEHHDYTPFEYACQLGNIQSLKLIFTHQEPQENNPIYLNGLLQSIAANQLEVTRFLLNHPAYQRIIEKHQKDIIHHIQEYGHYHLLEVIDEILAQDMLNLQIPLPMEELHHSLSLEIPEQIALKELSAYYQSSISQKSALQHLEDIQEKLASLYQQQPIGFQVDKESYLFLPLSWEAFHLLRSSFDEDTQNQMLHAYLNHPIHCAWRFFLNVDPWSSQTIDFNAYHADIRWMLILMWVVAHDPHLLNPREVLSVEERTSLFICELANLRHQAWPDQILQKFLIHSVSGHPLTKILDSVQLRREHHEFIQNHWLHYHNTLSHDTLLQVHLDWSHYILNPRTKMPKSLKICQLTEHDNQMFEEHMSRKWGSKWSDNLQLIQESRKNLLNPKACLMFKESFQFAIDEALEQARSVQMHQFNFFYHEERSNHSPELDHHHKIN